MARWLWSLLTQVHVAPVAVVHLRSREEAVVPDARQVEEKVARQAAVAYLRPVLLHKLHAHLGHLHIGYWPGGNRATRGKCTAREQTDQ